MFEEKLDKVIAGLGACTMGLCQSCPYGEYGTPRCRTEVMVDAHNLIQRLTRQLGYVRAERDAAISLNAMFIRAHMDEEVE